jgi:hypothetical protein
MNKADFDFDPTKVKIVYEKTTMMKFITDHNLNGRFDLFPHIYNVTVTKTDMTIDQ